MDLRRPVRPPNPSARRGLFPIGGTSRRPNTHLNPTLSTTSLHIPAEAADPKDDLVERDSSGNYCMQAPGTNIRSGSAGSRNELDEETDQENQMIALYGKQNNHWDQAAILAEIRAALESSLEKKVLSLEHDRWMFEGEGKSKN
ncbi:hypothetical protein BDV95DRAFT_579542 [Massariosphaeria phaeospora]|uniref:Uncharacterized protein n=1 Tax=Massariosphaeria phaeospora TaxID=100035 RepID=A0A7C8I1G8_9PLEO|nr:hypothetical protein BDV95DRAFT_579542 [Massariosphaeria phaeospora]